MYRNAKNCFEINLRNNIKKIDKKKVLYLFSNMLIKV